MSSGYFSLSFRSLRAQLDTLLECAGGESIVSLLDELSKLEDPERKALLNAFLSVAKELSEVSENTDDGAVSGPTDETSLAIKICDEILRELNPASIRRSHLQVVPGGRTENSHNKVVRLDRSMDDEPTPPPPFKPVA